MAELSRIILEFGEEAPKFSIENNVQQFNGMAPRELYFPEPNYPAMYMYYGLDVKDFREKVANLMNPLALEKYSGQVLNLNWITSADEMAARAGKIPKESFFQLAAIGVTKTKDNQIVVGIRGGAVTPERVDRFASGLYGTPPAGGVKFRESYTFDPIRDTIIDEFKEEIGDFEIVSKKLLGCFEAYKPGPTGIKFITAIETDATIYQIQKTNLDSNELYSQLRAKGASPCDIEFEFEQKKLPVDGWEHKPVFGIPDDDYVIRKFIETQPQNFAGISDGALKLYANMLKRQKIMKLFS